MNLSLEKLKAVSHQTRLRIMRLFVEFDIELCTCEIMDALKKPQYCISKNLQILRRSGLLIESRKKRMVFFKLNKENSFNIELFKCLKKISLDKVPYSDDNSRLDSRLKLRVNGKCVITYPCKS